MQGAGVRGWSLGGLEEGKSGPCVRKRDHYAEGQKLTRSMKPFRGRSSASSLDLTACPSEPDSPNPFLDPFRHHEMTLLDSEPFAWSLRNV